MRDLLDGIFNIASTLLAVPLLFVFVAAGFGILRGQKAELAFAAAFNTLFRIAGSAVKALIRSFDLGRNRRSRAQSLRNNRRNT